MIPKPNEPGYFTVDDLNKLFKLLRKLSNKINWPECYENTGGRTIYFHSPCSCGNIYQGYKHRKTCYECRQMKVNN